MDIDWKILESFKTKRMIKNELLKRDAPEFMLCHLASTT